MAANRGVAPILGCHFDRDRFVVIMVVHSEAAAANVARRDME